MFWVHYLHNLIKEQDGQDVVEYAMILGLVSVVAYVAVLGTGANINGIWQFVETTVAGISGPAGP